MSKSKVASNPELDPTMPKVELVLGDKTHYLVFTFEALALAESKLRAAGINANLLLSLDLSSWDATRLVPLLYAALITFDPEITPTAVTKMVKLKDLNNILNALLTAWKASQDEQDGDNVQAPLEG